MLCTLQGKAQTSAQIFPFMPYKLWHECASTKVPSTPLEFPDKGKHQDSHGGQGGWEKLFPPSA